MRNNKGQFVIGNKEGFQKGHPIYTTSGQWKKGRKIPKEEILRRVNSRKGYRHSEETKKKISKQNWSKESRKKLSDLKKGNKCYNWKGGITPENKRIRNSFEYALWRKSVFERDNFTCQKFKVRGGRLHPHHINNFADFPELRLAIDNGITLSEKAHREFHILYGKRNNTKEQLFEFLNKG